MIGKIYRYYFIVTYKLYINGEYLKKKLKI